MSRTSSGISISGSADTSCWIRPIGKIGERSSGPAGSIVSGRRGGAGGPGRSAIRLTQCVGISLSGSRIFVSSAIGGKFMPGSAGGAVVHDLEEVVDARQAEEL